MSTTYEQLQAIGKSAAHSIADMVAALECDYDRLEELRAGDQSELSAEEQDELTDLIVAASDCESRDDAERLIQESPLEITLSGTWSMDEEPRADKAYILLGTGGPATRVVIELTEHMEPGRAYIQAQDWGTPWTDCTGVIDQDTLLTYCNQFYFGEG